MKVKILFCNKLLKFNTKCISCVNRLTEPFFLYRKLMNSMSLSISGQPPTGGRE